MPDPRPAFARREVLLVAAAVGLLLLALSGRYGYHRDELYFLEAGRHLAWGYPDQPPLVALLARLGDLIGPGSLVVLRLPSTLSSMGVVVLTGLIARELGATRRGQIFAAATAAISGIVLATGHLLSTTTIALLGWTTLTYLLVRILRGPATTRLWLIAGIVSGLTLQANPLLAAFLVVLPIALLVGGPRQALRTRGPYVAAFLAAAIAAPYVIWQATHGFPQVDVARGIADGDSGSSASRAMFVPLQLLQVGPWLAPVWITGLVQLFRSSRLRALAISYVALFVLFLAAAAKPYYLAGLYPLLLAAGAQPVVDRLRTRGSAILLCLSLPVLVFTLPVLPVADAGKVLAVNYDSGETIGWPDFVAQTAEVYDTMPAGTVILTRNYGEAGALDRYGAGHDLPSPYSGHMAYFAWGPPPPTADSVLAIGIEEKVLRRLFTTVTPVGTLRNRWDIDNDENGTHLYACSGLRRPWADSWHLLKRY